MYNNFLLDFLGKASKVGNINKFYSYVTYWEVSLRRKLTVDIINNVFNTCAWKQ